MGLRNDDLLEEQRDAMLRRTLLALEQTPDTLPHDLMQRVASRLPAVPPAVAARSLARYHTRRRITLWSIGVPVLLVALVSLLGVVGWGTELALMIGDGSSGLSRLLLMLHLLAKPVLWIVGGINIVFFAAIVLLIIGGIWLWWRTIQHTSMYPKMEGER